MEQHEEELDLGQVVAIWEVMVMDGEEEKVFSLVQLEDTALGLFSSCTEDADDPLEIDAFKLPEGAFVAVFLPTQEQGNAHSVGEQRGAPDRTPDTTGTPPVPPSSPVE